MLSPIERGHTFHLPECQSRSEERDKIVSESAWMKESANDRMQRTTLPGEHSGALPSEGQGSDIGRGTTQGTIVGRAHCWGPRAWHSVLHQVATR